MTPRAFVSSTLSILAAGIALPAVAAGAQPVIEPTDHHPNPYQTINDYFELPDEREWGSTSAVPSIRTGPRSGWPSGAEPTAAQARRSVRS